MRSSTSFRCGASSKRATCIEIVVIIAEAAEAKPDDKLLHAVFRRNGRATAEQGFDIDYYDLYWLRNADAATARDVWRANLLGGNRARSLIERLRSFPTLQDFAKARGWDFGEGFIVGGRGTQHRRSYRRQELASDQLPFGKWIGYATSRSGAQQAD